MDINDPQFWTYLMYAMAIIPGLIIARFLLFMIMPKFILRKFFSGKQGYKKGTINKKRPKYFDDD